MKSIKAKLVVFFGLLTGGICIGLSTIALINSSNALTSNLGQTLPVIAEQAASNIQGRIKGELTSLEVVAARNDIKDINISWDKKVPILLEEVKRNGSIKIGIADKNGEAIYTDGSSINIKDRAYFQKALAGESSASDPVISKATGAAVVVYAVPIKNNNEVVAVLLSSSDGNKLSELTNEVKFAKTGNAFMIKKDGTVIAHNNKDLVTNMYNPIEEAKKDPKLKGLADIENKMIQGETGIGQYYFDGIDKIVGYAPVNGTEWSVAVVVGKTDILSELNGLQVAALISGIVFLLIGLGVVYIIASNISKGIKSTSEHLDLLANGDLSKEVPQKLLNKKDEIGVMTNSMKKMQESLGMMIGKIKENSLNINGQSENLSAITEEIAGATQNVTEAITEVAEGASSQSEELMHITEILDEFSVKLSGMVREIQVVDSNSREISVMANDSSSEMNELNQSVTNVSSSFKEFYGKIMSLGRDINEINEITGLINSVAEQTNLLALNAAIEAARAGESGKGFSVVAEEIRKLAEQSKTSSENISKLINAISSNTNVIVEQSVVMDDEMMNQAKFIDNSIASFKKIIQAVDEIIPKIDTVKNSANNIENDKQAILTRVEGLSSISEELSASAEEVSASAEEMNATTEEVASSAQMLSSMTNEMIDEVNKFKVEKK